MKAVTAPAFLVWLTTPSEPFAYPRDPEFRAYVDGSYGITDDLCLSGDFVVA